MAENNVNESNSADSNSAELALDFSGREGRRLSRRSAARKASQRISQVLDVAPASGSGRKLRGDQQQEDDEEAGWKTLAANAENISASEEEERGENETSSDDDDDDADGDKEEDNKRPQRKRYSTRSKIRSEKQTKSCELYVGRRLLRYFDGEAFFGEVREYLPPREEGEVPLFRVAHDDGDKEELELFEVEKAIQDLEDFSLEQGGGKYTLRDRRKSREVKNIYTVSSFGSSSKKNVSKGKESSEESSYEESSDSSSSAPSITQRPSRSRSRGKMRKRRKLRGRSSASGRSRAKKRRAGASPYISLMKMIGRGNSGKRRSRKRRRVHFDSSSEESSDSSLSDASSFGGSGDVFDKYEKRRHQKQLESIQPVQSSGGSSGMDRATKRDLARVDANPVAVDPSIDFDSVGGMQHHVAKLKEMIILPLMYPDAFDRFGITPPRGVIFHGPPGTGKTLMARALANCCSVQSGRPVAFFMRKGADCLSKWVGEAERQLRLLFEQAKRHQPSIIFFDEIDGLAPVRSSKQDQIHASIVSTLLALMDGLDSRGQVVVIGATNRVDSIDPALRRPGRFDRELLFNLPSLAGRRHILDIHMRSWNPSPSASFKDYLAEKTVGYCGADIKSLCAEASLAALRRRYPQVYTSSQRLKIDPESVKVLRVDFEKALDTVVPASRRSAQGGVGAAKLPGELRCLLGGSLKAAMEMATLAFPCKSKKQKEAEEEDAMVSEWDPLRNEDKRELAAVYGDASVLTLAPCADAPLARFPKMCVQGDGANRIAAAMLHDLEDFSVQSCSLGELIVDAESRSPEESITKRFIQARRAAPSILFIPSIDAWWRTASDSLRATLIMLLETSPSDQQVLLLATSRCSLADLHVDLDAAFSHILQCVHDGDGKDRFCEDLRKLILDRITEAAAKWSRSGGQASAGALETLEVDPLPSAPVPSTGKNDALLAPVSKSRLKKEEHYLRELRVAMRACLAEIMRERKYKVFVGPVDAELVPDYYEVIKQPMWLEKVCEKVDDHEYLCLDDFFADISLIEKNVKAYNPLDPKDHRGKHIAHNAAGMKDDMTSSFYRIEKHLKYSLYDRCKSIAARRRAVAVAAEDASTSAAQNSARSKRRGAPGLSANVDIAALERALRDERRRRRRAMSDDATDEAGCGDASSSVTANQPRDGFVNIADAGFAVRCPTTGSLEDLLSWRSRVLCGLALLLEKDEACKTQLVFTFGKTLIHTDMARKVDALLQSSFP